MDMYQKRKVRKEKNEKKSEEQVNGKININCVNLIYGNSPENIDI